MQIEKHMTIDKKNTKALKEFAVTMSWAFPAFFSLLLPWLFSFQFQYWPLAISVTLMALWLIKPEWIYYPYKGWMTVAGIIGWVNTRIILGFCFYFLFLPIGRLMKLLGKLDYQDKIDNSKTSNYQINTTKTDSKSLENPF